MAEFLRTNCSGPEYAALRHALESMRTSREMPGAFPEVGTVARLDRIIPARAITVTYPFRDATPAQSSDVA